MSIVFACPYCGISLSAPDECAGRASRCRCGATVIVPAAHAGGSGSPAVPQKTALGQAIPPAHPGSGSPSHGNPGQRGKTTDRSRTGSPQATAVKSVAPGHETHDGRRGAQGGGIARHPVLLWLLAAGAACVFVTGLVLLFLAVHSMKELKAEEEMAERLRGEAAREQASAAREQARNEELLAKIGVEKAANEGAVAEAKRLQVEAKKFRDDAVKEPAELLQKATEAQEEAKRAQLKADQAKANEEAARDATRREAERLENVRKDAARATAEQEKQTEAARKAQEALREERVAFAKEKTDTRAQLAKEKADALAQVAEERAKVKEAAAKADAALAEARKQREAANEAATRTAATLKAILALPRIKAGLNGLDSSEAKERQVAVSFFGKLPRGSYPDEISAALVRALAKEVTLPAKPSNVIGPRFGPRRGAEASAADLSAYLKALDQVAARDAYAAVEALANKPFAGWGVPSAGYAKALGQARALGPRGRLLAPLLVRHLRYAMGVVPWEGGRPAIPAARELISTLNAVAPDDEDCRTVLRDIRNSAEKKVKALLD